MDTELTRQAQSFLKSPDLLERILSDMELLGYVGEDKTKLLGYLIALSRKLPKPLSGIVASISSSGKSTLLDTIELLTPKEDVVFASRLTPQALYYMPKHALKHKLLIIEERAGSEPADYSIRSLQSKGRLSLAIPVKNQTVFFEVEGPVSVLETTSDKRINQENSSRCFILQLDESKEQTERIHNLQRLYKTDEGILQRARQSQIIMLHTQAQRLLKNIPVVIPYAQKLSFPAHSVFSRRENQKFLTLIEAITLLHQYQRKIVKKFNSEFIQSSVSDYKAAFELYEGTYLSCLLGSHPLAGALFKAIKGIAKDAFTRSDIAKIINWPKYKVRDNISYLEQAGLLIIIEKTKGGNILYKLDKQIELTSPEELEE